MSSNFDIPSIVDPLVEEITDLSGQFVESFERLPTLAEFLTLLSEGIRWSRDESLADINGINLEKLDATVTGQTSSANAFKEVSAAELTDSVLAAACRTIATASRYIFTSSGNRPTLMILCQVLSDALRQCPADLLLDASPADIGPITGRLRKRGKVIAKPGDIVAVPTPDGGQFYLACVTTKNRFGTAFGFFIGTFPPKVPPPEQASRVLRNAIYSGEQCLASGRWVIVGNDEVLRRSFPADQELFHRPTKDAPFGQAERASGAIRRLTEQEAVSIGVLDKSYRQLYTCNFLEKQIPTLIAHG